MENIDNFFMSLKDFLDGAEDSDLFKKTAEEIRREELGKLINETRLNRNRTWSILGGQVFGAEIF